MPAGVVAEGEPAPRGITDPATNPAGHPTNYSSDQGLTPAPPRRRPTGSCWPPTSGPVGRPRSPVQPAVVPVVSLPSFRPLPNVSVAVAALSAPHSPRPRIGVVRGQRGAPAMGGHTLTRRSDSLRIEASEGAPRGLFGAPGLGCSRCWGGPCRPCRRPSESAFTGQHSLIGVGRSRCGAPSRQRLSSRSRRLPCRTYDGSAVAADSCVVRVAGTRWCLG